MAKTAHYRFRYFCPIRNKKMETRYRLTEQEARERYGPEAERLDHTLEYRDMGGPNRESTSHLMSTPGRD